MRLAEFIVQHREQIINEWETFARSLLGPARQLSSSALRDHAAGILDDIVADMCTSQTREEQSAKSKGHGELRRLEGAGRSHALRRLETGFTLDQLVAEYRALRASVLGLWTADQQPDSAQDEITRFNESIDEALTESTNRYMETIERHRDEFVGILGHDLRNPLSAIIMGASVLTATDRLDDRSARIASQILTSAQRMNRLVDDLLDLTRTRLGRGIPIQRAPVDLAAVCRQVVTELKGAHPREILRFAWKGDVHGDWDGDRLAQVVSNLVANALQHGRPRGLVSVVLQGDVDEVVLQVHNEGPPIPPSAVKTLFQPMVRHRYDESERPTSLGLGLFIAEQIVAVHGGTIGVTSTEADGTTFTVHLPRHTSAPTRPRANGATASP
jgi:signal transduction histidine kinase